MPTEKENKFNGPPLVDTIKKENGENGLTKNQLKKKKKKKAKKERKQQSSNLNEVKEEVKEEEEKVEIEYVPANPLEGLDPNDPTFQEFANIFQKFNTEEDDLEMLEEEAAEGQGEGEADEDKEQKSKKQLKKEKRLSIAVLKSLVKRPDLVEAWDVTAADPGILVFLKSYRNAVPVPRHWNQKRRYLQGKRGIEKTPFQLPEFIAATGIAKIRAGGSKPTGKEKMNPKLGKLDIDYQVLHDAFFKYQTKPKLTIHGDLYYEGKEFEITLKEKRPGQLSDALKRALGMPEGAPPPWLINMQRYGPPPAYPNLKIPGLNAPIPEGCRYGYHPGGWGKPPVDEFGRPLYGDVFGTAPPPTPTEISQPIEKSHWGEFMEEEEEEVEEEGAPLAGEEQAEEPPADGLATPSGLSTPSFGQTPETIDLRKGKASKEEADDSGKQLFQVLEQKDRSVGAAIMGSTHGYVLPTEKREMKSKSAAVNLIRSQAGEKLDIALEPDEVENLESLTSETLQKKYDNEMSKKMNVPREDVSDIMEEHAQKEQKKRKKDQKDSSRKRSKNNKNVF
jgi:splicing factor 3B subunit 2